MLNAKTPQDVVDELMKGITAKKLGGGRLMKSRDDTSNWEVDSPAMIRKDFTSTGHGGLMYTSGTAQSSNYSNMAHIKASNG